MYQAARRPAWVEVDLDALEYNVRNIQARAGNGTDLIGVIKADAYGHGSVEVAKLLRECGVSYFAVATVQEGIELRQARLEEPILVLGLIPDMYAADVVRYRLMPVLASYENAKAFSDAASEKERVVDAMIAIDTGMGRIGYRVETAAEKQYATEEIQQMEELPNLHLHGLISHFATSDEADREYTRTQLRLFNDFYEKLSGEGISLPWPSIANSAAIMDHKCAVFGAVRPGIILYGCYPSSEVNREHLSLRQVMSVKANITQVKTIPAGSAVSYGREFIAKRPSRIATLPLGYADGYVRGYAGKVDVLIHGRRAPIVGRICMDQCMADVTDIPDVEAGDEAVIMGVSGEEQITADELAGKLGTINYEVLCLFGMRMPKIYIRNGEIAE